MFYLLHFVPNRMKSFHPSVCDLMFHSEVHTFLLFGSVFSFLFLFQNVIFDFNVPLNV